MFMTAVDDEVPIIVFNNLRGRRTRLGFILAIRCTLSSQTRANRPEYDGCFCEPAL
jgi:hypothetical protein